MNNYCDRCGPAVSAKYLVSLPSGNILVFGSHHALEDRDGIKRIGGFLYPIREEDDEL